MERKEKEGQRNVVFMLLIYLKEPASLPINDVYVFEGNIMNCKSLRRNICVRAYICSSDFCFVKRKRINIESLRMCKCSMPTDA